jgi:hypothetical protein
MATVSAHGITVALPIGFEAHVFRRSPGPGEHTYAVAHFATFPLPPDTADFGGGAVNLMGPGDVFTVLFEYGPESLGNAIFARRGMPRRLNASDFRPYVLRRGLAGQAGSQWFFTEQDRPFTLYSVMGSYARRGSLIGRVNQLLHGVTVAPASADPPTGGSIFPASALHWN